jgi:recombinational DNA repair protein RecT
MTNPESESTAVAVTTPDPYDATAQQNQLARMTTPTNAGEHHLALARKTKLGGMLLAENSAFYAFASAAGMNPAMMVMELGAVVAKKPEIAGCTPASIIGFMLDAAKLRLSIGRGIYPVVIPKDKGKETEETRLEGWVGYKGAKELAMRPGAIRDCWGTIHFEGDDFESVEAPIPMVTRHVFGPNRGKMDKALGAYATLLYPGGRTRAKYFTREKIESYRKRNPTNSWKSSPWVTSEEEMWMAKAILHAVNDLPHNSPELAHLAAMIEREDRADGITEGDDA